jgi:hypothetical protein
MVLDARPMNRGYWSLRGLRIVPIRGADGLKTRTLPLFILHQHCVRFHTPVALRVSRHDHCELLAQSFSVGNRSG